MEGTGPRIGYRIYFFTKAKSKNRILFFISVDTKPFIPHFAKLLIELNLR